LPAFINRIPAQLNSMIPRSTPGLTIVDDWSSFGQRTTAIGTVTLENVRVRPEWIIPGYKAYERPTLTGPLSQIIQAAIDAGIAHAALRETIQSIRTRSRPWIDSKVEHASEDPLTIAEIGDLEIKLHAADALLERAASILDQGEQQLDEQTAAAGSIAVAEAKALTTEIAVAATNKLFELAGTQSTLAKYNLDLHWRNARVHTLHDSRISKADPSIGQIPQNHYFILEVLRSNASEEQKQFFFEQVLGGARFGNALSELGTKTVGDYHTRISRTARGFLLRGRKYYSTGALFAHWIPVVAKDERDYLVLAFVQRGTPGLTLVDDWNSFGQRTTGSGTTILEDISLPDFAVIPYQKSFDEPTPLGPLAQFIHAAVDLGIAQAAIRDTMEFVRTRSRPWIDSNVEKASEDPLTIAQFAARRDLIRRRHGPKP
jgi:alkylation response protein AidB-like acyl-CoA dehydrogenase